VSLCASSSLWVYSCKWLFVWLQLIGWLVGWLLFCLLTRTVSLCGLVFLVSL
jgi:hypothetical protein